MPPVGFEPAISAGERPKTYALDHAAIAGTGRPRGRPLQGPADRAAGHCRDRLQYFIVFYHFNDS
jgi:hypothetical protein